MVKFKSIEEIMEGHMKGMQKVHEFLAEHGADHWHDKYRCYHGIDIQVHHANEYIECGPHDEDPDDILYYVYTAETYAFKVPFSKLQGMLKALKEMQGLSHTRIADDVRVETDITNQFIMEKRIHCDDYGLEKLTLRIEFWVYHHTPDWEAYK
jgi:hypothetical protein